MNKAKNRNIRQYGLSLMLIFISFTLYAQREYYPDEMQGKNKGELKTILYNKLRNHVRIQYGSNFSYPNNPTLTTWVVFHHSDVRPDGKVWDMYSNKSYFFNSKPGGSTSGMNIEHSAPKSWWGEGTDSKDFQYDASFDLHHLVPSDGNANMAKSNYPLGEVINNIIFDNGVSKVGQAVIAGRGMSAFEPADEYKGDFARMYMYIATCYQNYKWKSYGTNIFEDGVYPTLTSFGKELLLKWHRQDPVSQKEIDRNNAVYEFQKNRNPFIDYPELAEYIWGNKTSEGFEFPVATITNYKQNDIIVIPATKTTGSIEISLKGDSFGNDVTLSTSSPFEINKTRLSAEDLNKGVKITIRFNPGTDDNTGFYSGKLRIEGDDLAKDFTLQLYSVLVPAEINRIQPVGLKTTYKTTDQPVELKLNKNVNNCIWTSEKGIISENGTFFFNPSSAGKGIHIIKYRSADYSGNIRIVVE
ncbi:endonuclease I family protein [Coprobacter tertius]|uniref:Endonuclease n=1 Tax=Coprobacter tertius TaxID=2944915 RepID=A0ABT1MJW8_9BACT|nr:endonuclease [Coprobacter tertius]MCP9612659.1 endonuclease [Coprobacter tertius]